MWIPGRRGRGVLIETTANQPHDWLLVFDGDCGFCRYSVDYARAVTDVEAPGRIRYEPYQNVLANYPDITRQDFERSIQLFTAAQRYQGAEAAFRVLALAPRLRAWLWCYQYIPLFALIAEASYRFVARHRGAVYTCARLLFGARLLPADYQRTAGLVTRGIGLAALCAFLSWWWQAAGLIGADGILPVADYFAGARLQLGPSGPLLLPSLYWLSSTDAMTNALCAAGTLASLALLLRVFPVVAALIAYVCYLSLLYGGQIFLQFQWDVLLVEALILAAILSHRSRLGILLTRLLVFRFMFLSGVVKLASHDPTWSSLSALDVHFETQPLPTLLAWYANQLPQAWLHAGVAVTFVIELVLPFFIFAPRNLRLIAAAGFVLLEVLILLTGNYNFFNLLTIVLCLALLDDRALRCSSVPSSRPRAGPVWRSVVFSMALLGVLQIHATWDRGGVRQWELALLGVIEPWRIVNGYGLFAVMTTERDELIVEASDDGNQWRELAFRFKPGKLTDAPQWVAPYQPRLDWQLWFAALTTREGAPWFDNFAVQLLRGAPAVTELLASSSFSEQPPRYVRVLRYRYHFTSFEQRRRSGAWWRREYLGVWYPPAGLAEAP